MSTATASRSRGRQRELHWIAKRIAEGWVAYRVDGAGDIIEAKDGVTNILQCKSTLTPYSHFLPADRERLRLEADIAGWNAYLLYWPKGKGLNDAKLIPVSEWP